MATSINDFVASTFTALRRRTPLAAQRISRSISAEHHHGTPSDTPPSSPSPLPSPSPSSSSLLTRSGTVMVRPRGVRSTSSSSSTSACSSPATTPSTSRASSRGGSRRVMSKAPASRCTTVAYSFMFGGVAVKCRYFDDISVILLPRHEGDAGEEGEEDGHRDLEGRERAHGGEEVEDGEDDDGPRDDQVEDGGRRSSGHHPTRARRRGGSRRRKEGSRRHAGEFQLHVADLRARMKETYGRDDLRVIYIDRDGDRVPILSDDSLNYAFDDWRGALGHGDRFTRTLMADTGVPTSWRLLLEDDDDEP